MKRETFYLKYNFIFMMLFFAFNSLSAQVNRTSELYLTAQKLDSLIFEEGFNNCNYKVLEEILAPDLEFYHDKGGIQNKQEFIEATKNNICNNAYGKITRKAVGESIEVFSLEKNGEIYGLLQTGRHEFYMQETGKKNHITGTAKFSCLWLKEKESWKLKRVFSYDHKSVINSR